MTDLYFTHEGDFLCTDGDLVLASGTDEMRQLVARLVKNDGGLSQLVGLLLTPETLAMGESILLSRLMSSSRLAAQPIEVRAIPVNATQALFVVGHTAISAPLSTIPFDFTRGVISPRDTTTIGL